MEAWEDRCWLQFLKATAADQSNTVSGQGGLGWVRGVNTRCSLQLILACFGGQGLMSRDLDLGHKHFTPAEWPDRTWYSLHTWPFWLNHRQARPSVLVVSLFDYFHRLFGGSTSCCMIRPASPEAVRYELNAHLPWGASVHEYGAYLLDCCTVAALYACSLSLSLPN